MIIVNGSFRLKYKQPGGFDEDGYPLKPRETFGVLIPCQYRALEYNALSHSNGEALITARYEVLVDAEEHDVDSEILKLYDSNAREVGEFSIISKEVLSSVLETRILI